MQNIREFASEAAQALIERQTKVASQKKLSLTAGHRNLLVGGGLGALGGGLYGAYGALKNKDADRSVIGDSLRGALAGAPLGVLGGMGANLLSEGAVAGVAPGAAGKPPEISPAEAFAIRSSQNTDNAPGAMRQGLEAVAGQYGAIGGGALGFATSRPGSLARATGQSGMGGKPSLSQFASRADDYAKSVQDGGSTKKMVLDMQTMAHNNSTAMRALLVASKRLHANPADAAARRVYDKAMKSMGMPNDPRLMSPHLVKEIYNGKFSPGSLRPGSRAVAGGLGGAFAQHGLTSLFDSLPKRDLSSIGSGVRSGVSAGGIGGGSSYSPVPTGSSTIRPVHGPIDPSKLSPKALQMQAMRELIEAGKQ